METKLKDKYKQEDRNNTDLLATLNKDVSKADHIFTEKIDPNVQKTVQSLITSKDYHLALRTILQDILSKAANAPTAINNVLQAQK